MKRIEAEKVVRDIIMEEFDVEEASIIPEADFERDLGIDDLDITVLVMELEDRLEEKGFEIEISGDDERGFTTLQKVVDCLVVKGVCEA